MKSATIPFGLLLLILSGCNSGSKVPGTPSLYSEPLPRNYNGTATVGDFLTLTVDPGSNTIAYQNLSNGDSETVPFTVQNSGAYTINDPSGNLAAVYEVPNYALLIDANKVGQDHQTTALIIGVLSTPISIADEINKTFNFMVFRTSEGGIEIGSGGMDSKGNISYSTYWPCGDDSRYSPFHRGTAPATSIEQDPSGDFLKVTDMTGGTSYIFAAGDALVVDRPDGTYFGFKQATSKDFDPTFTGTYKTTLYKKLASSGQFQCNGEVNSPTLDNGLLKISSSGGVIVTDSQNQIVAQGTLTPVSDVDYLYNSGGIFSLNNPCYGLFTFRLTTSDSQQDIYVGFEGQSVIFSSFRTTLPLGPSITYDYFYGVGLKQAEAEHLKSR